MAETELSQTDLFRSVFILICLLMYGSKSEKDTSTFTAEAKVL